MERGYDYEDYGCPMCDGRVRLEGNQFDHLLKDITCPGCGAELQLEHELVDADEGSYVFWLELVRLEEKRK